MPLRDEIQRLGWNSLTALDESHDYYTFTKRVWRFVDRVVREGRRFSFRNINTGTRVDQHLLLERSQRYETRYLTSSAFQHFVTVFEDYLFGLLRAWLAAYPASLSKKQIEFGTLLKAGQVDLVVRSVVDKELNELKYERVADWFAYLEKLVKLGCPNPAIIEQLAEIKATRDILVHNQGIANATYISKSGALARCREGEELTLPETYHRASWQTIRSLVQDMTTAAVSKAG